MSAPLLILSSEPSSDSDNALCAFAEFLGVKMQTISISGQKADSGAEELQPLPAHKCLAMNFGTARSLMAQGSFQKLSRQSGCLFVYGFSATDQECPDLKLLTDGAVESVKTVQSRKKEFAIHSGSSSAQFPVSGKTYSVDSAVAVNVFSSSTPTQKPHAESIISVNGQSYFISIGSGDLRVFLLADNSLLDIDKPVNPEFAMRDYYAQWCALAIFLRSVFGSDCWTTPNPVATVTIDDPSLQKRYGFVDYETLLPEIEKSGCALTIGFIPYNYRRSDPTVVNNLRRHAHRFSITVHGCDHTGGEFANHDERWLNAIANCALERMDSLHHRTQMPYDDVMIFPQGRFSAQAMKVLKECRYVAAVNSSPWAAEVKDGVLTARCLLDVAVTRYSGFPLFVRRYPRDAFDFAFDAFFQKPLIVVEHHEYFKGGYEPFTGFIKQINALGATKPAWMPLRMAVTSSCVMRPAGEAQYQVRFFTPVFRLQNPTGKRCSFSLMKPETSDLVKEVVWSGRGIPFEFQSGYLRCEVQTDPGEEGELRIVYREVQKNPHRPSAKYRCKVFFRRLLSDMRDNYLARNRLLLAAAQKAKNLVSKEP